MLAPRSLVDAEALLAAWSARDDARALHEGDRRAVVDTSATRALILEFFLRDEDGSRDLYSACANLGRLLAEAGASPTLAVTTVDMAGQVLVDANVVVDGARLTRARASVAEGYVRAVRESERASARDAWEYPACTVRLDADTAAVIANYPADDVDALAVADWAARIATGASRDRVKRVVLAGASRPAAEVEAALSLVGIEVMARLPEAPRWFRFPFVRASR